MLKKLIVFWFKRRRWKFVGSLPKQHNKTIFIAAPNISKRDFLVGVAVIKLSRFKSRILVDKRFFFFPLGSILKRLGAKSFDYRGGKESWRQLLNSYNARRQYSVVCALRSGDKERLTDCIHFHYLASKLNLPIVLVRLDHGSRTVRLHNYFFTGPDRDRDIHFIERWLNQTESTYHQPDT